jgi:hypothetical protein
MFNNGFSKTVPFMRQCGLATDNNMALCIACRVTKSKNTDSEYIINIDFELQQWM